MSLLHYLSKESIYCLGSVRRNTLEKSCKLREKRKILKSDVLRGTYHENVEGTVFLATSWKDNKRVFIAFYLCWFWTNGHNTRYDRKLKMNVQISCPRVIKECNTHMGGVDLMDSFIGWNHICIKSRKWKTRLFYHLLDMTVINAWIMYKNVGAMKGKSQKDIMKLADFRTELAHLMPL